MRQNTMWRSTELDADTFEPEYALKHHVDALSKLARRTAQQGRKLWKDLCSTSRPLNPTAGDWTRRVQYAGSPGPVASARGDIARTFDRMAKKLTAMQTRPGDDDIDAAKAQGRRSSALPRSRENVGQHGPEGNFVFPFPGEGQRSHAESSVLTTFSGETLPAPPTVAI